MTGAWALFRKDFNSFCRSWIGVLAVASFLFLAGLFFILFLMGYAQISMEGAGRGYEGLDGLNLTGFVMGGVLLNLGIVILFFAPLLSMRSLAEEKRMGTLELLYTYPLSDWEIVAGKYLTLLAELALLFLPTVTYAGVMGSLGVDLDWGIVAAGMIGFFLLGSAFLAIGLFFSTLTENQIVAASVTFAFLLGLWVLEWITGFLPRPWSVRLAAFSPFVHFRDFSLGILDVSDMVYFVALCLFFLFMSLRVIETRNWKG